MHIFCLISLLVLSEGEANVCSDDGVCTGSERDAILLQSSAQRHKSEIADKSEKTTTAASVFAEFERVFEEKHRFFEEALESRTMSESELGAMGHFKKFLRANYRTYFDFKDVSEYKKRMKHFNHTLEMIKIRNAHEKKHTLHPNPATHGVTKYADWSKEEFKQILGHKPGTVKVAGGAQKPAVLGQLASEAAEGEHSNSLAQIQRSVFMNPHDKYSNCAAIKKAYGCGVEINNNRMSEICPAECGGSSSGGGSPSGGGSSSGERDKYSNCATIKAQAGCSAQLNSGETMTQVCPLECPSSSSGGGSTPAPWHRPNPPRSTNAPCTKNWASTTTIRNQGACGDCWAFATVEAIRSAHIKQHGTDPGVLSTQFLVDCMPAKHCSEGVNGCCGGNPQVAMEWIEKHGGVPTQHSYGDVFSHRASLLENRTSLLEGGPVSHTGQGITYSGNNPKKVFPCKSGISKAVILTGAVSRVQSEDEMAQHVCNAGTLPIALDASAWQTYTGGVLSAASCSHRLDHAVHLIGLDQDKNSWIVQNSWGPDWGVTLDGVKVPKDKYSNCKRLQTEHGCQAHVTGGMTVAQACPASCASGSAPSDGGYILLAYGQNTCGLATDAVKPPSTQSA